MDCLNKSLMVSWFQSPSQIREVLVEEIQLACENCLMKCCMFVDELSSRSLSATSPCSRLAFIRIA